MSVDIIQSSRPVKVVVATTVMLSFVSFWRAAAIVLNDLGSSAYYVGGIAEQAVGKAAPWFILGVMLFSYAVRAVYIESSSSIRTATNGLKAKKKAALQETPAENKEFFSFRLRMLDEPSTRFLQNRY